MTVDLSLVWATLTGLPSVTVLAVSVFLLFFLVRMSRMSSAARHLPPGPRGFPLLGVLPLMGVRPHLTVQLWWQRYGDLVSVRMGSRLVVIVNGVEMMKECFVRRGDAFAGRPDNYFKRITKGKGLVFNEGDSWREHRRFTLSCLRDFGMGKVVLEDRINDEVGHLLRELSAASRDGCRPLDPGPTLSRAVANVICTIIYGTRFDYWDETFVDNVLSLTESIRHQTMIGVVNFLPWLEPLLTVLVPVKRMLRRNVEQREVYARRQLEIHLQGAAHIDSPRDFTEAYLCRIRQLQQANKPTSFDESHLTRAIQDLFIAGTESVSTTLKWALLFMALHPDVQLKVQQELDKVIGPGRCTSMSDRASLPYTEATLMECQRRGNIALFNIPHATLVDTVVGGYRIPRGTWVFANRWGMHASERYWTDPEQFNPDRFLDSTGRVCRPDAFTPFGMGVRNCLGESFARVELFVIFSRLLATFSFRLPPNAQPPSLEPTVGLNMSPRPYTLLINRRWPSLGAA